MITEDCIKMYFNKKHFYINLAKYFQDKPLYLDGSAQNKPNIRKLMEQPWQQIKAKLWDELTDTLCNLEFIQAKAAAKMTYELVNDFNATFLEIPDNAKNINEKNEQHARLDKYVNDLVLFVNEEIFDLEYPESKNPWPQGTIDAEVERMKRNSTRLDRLNDFSYFIGREADNLQNYACEFPNFSIQQAWNYADNGPVGISAGNRELDVYKHLLLYGNSTRPPWNPFPHAIKTLKGHNKGIKAIAMSPDGKKAISSTEENCILWDLNTGQAINKVMGSSHGVTAIAITPDGKRGVWGDSNYTCCTWDLNTGQALSTQKVINSMCTSLVIAVDGRRAGSINIGPPFTFIVWDLITGQIISTLIGHTQRVYAAAMTPDGKRAITGSGDYTCITWDLSTGQIINNLKGHTEWVTAVDITPDGKKAISGSSSGICILWDLDTGQAIETLKVITSSRINAIAMTPDSKMAIAGTQDGICILWDLNTGQAIKTLIGHASLVTAIAISPDGKTAISGSYDKSCILWNLNTGQEINFKTRVINPDSVVAITPDGGKAFYVSDTDTCSIWDLKTVEVIYSLKNSENWANALGITPDGKQIVSCSMGNYSNNFDNTCKIRDLNTGQPIKTFQGNTSYITKVAITPEGKRVISCCYDGSSIIWDLNTEKVIETLEGHAFRVIAIAISPDGRSAITGFGDGSCTLWDLNTGKEMKTMKAPLRWVQLQIAITPDGKKAIVCNQEKCFLWDLKTGQTINIYQGQITDTTAIFITPDGRKALLIGDCTCIICDIESKKIVGMAFGTSNIIAAAYFPGGFFLCEQVGNVNGKRVGNVFILNLKKELLCPNGSIVTLRKMWDCELQQYQEPSADCPLCGHRFYPSGSILTTIDKIIKESGLRPKQSPCLELPEKYWEDSALISACPHCLGIIKFNPFIVGD